MTADIAAALSTAVYKDGQQTVTANIPMGGFKLTGIAAATVTGDALSYGRAAVVTSLDATGTISTTGVSGLVNSVGGQTISTTVGGIFSTQAVTVQAASGGVILNSGATAWVAASDWDAKKDFIPIPVAGALARVVSWRAGTYLYKTDASDAPRRIGLIAQDVQKTRPEAVCKLENGLLAMSLAETVPDIVAALAEVKIRLEALEAK